MTSALTAHDNGNGAIMPVMDIQQAVLRRQAIIDFTKAVMKPVIDYGRIPGTTKDTLLKPGAEKLTTLFGLSPRFEIVEKELDWTGEKHGGEAFFYFQYRCSLWRGDLLAGEGLGSCNSWEKKYRWRTASLSCPECGKEAIIKGKKEYGGGWLCFKRKGGCGYKFHDEDERITSQEIGQVPNDNPADLVNTLDKMAQKRALVAATLIAVNASEFFTQDVEDMDMSFIDGSYSESDAGGPGDLYPGTPPSGNGCASKANSTEVQTLNDYENRVYTGKPAEFFKAAADWIGCTEDEAKEGLRKLGYAALDKQPMERVKQLRRLHNAMLLPDQRPLFDDDTAVAEGAYSEA
jgi:predicted RNA-binding Zn-ribbon protein involved in translation (DUF1610 family)